MEATDPEILIEGPTGTGKSQACIFKIHRSMIRYPGARALMLRKTRSSLTQSGLYIFERFVIPPGWVPDIFGSTQRRFRQSYVYPNGSEIVIGGMDEPSRVMSSQYDLIYPMEATELSLDEWEHLPTRNRNNVMPYQQLLGDCNPSSGTHFLNQRCETGQTRRIVSRFEDNPSITEEYLQKLRNLTGVRRERFFLGRWASAEGAVYDNFDRRIHVIKRSELPKGAFTYTASQDWGFTNPGVLGIWARNGDGDLFLVEEIYRTNKTIEWWKGEAKKLRDRYRLTVVYCDPAEPDFIKQYRDAGIPAVPAFNNIRAGIDLVRERLEVRGNGRPRLFFLEDSLKNRDEELANDTPPKPWSTVQEFDNYVWPKDVSGRPLKEEPVDEFNHGLDMVRYRIMGSDLRPAQVPRGAIAKPRFFVPR